MDGDLGILQERLNAHGRRLEILEANQKSLEDGLAAIQRSLSQIKWIATGMVLMFLAQELGIAAMLQKLL